MEGILCKLFHLKSPRRRLKRLKIIKGKRWAFNPQGPRPQQGNTTQQTDRNNQPTNPSSQSMKQGGLNVTKVQ
jgi:hypothetical protein